MDIVMGKAYYDKLTAKKKAPRLWLKPKTAADMGFIRTAEARGAGKSVYIYEDLL